MTDYPPDRPQHKALTPDEQKALIDHAFSLGRKIETGQARVAKEMWALAAAVYEFHEGGCWGLIGYDTLEEFLAQSEVAMKRTQFFRLSKMYRDLHVVKRIPMKKLEQIEPTKAQAIAPAVIRGEVKVDKALADAAPGGLGVRDLRDEYGSSNGGRARGEDTPLAAEDEPVRVQCEHCHSWYIPIKEASDASTGG